MDTIETMAANADVVDVATSEGIATPTDGGAETPVAAPETNTAEDVTKTQAFSKRLNEKAAEIRASIEAEIWGKVNPTIAKMGGVAADGKPIQSFEDLQKSLEMQAMQEAAAKENLPVELYERLTKAEREAMDAKSMLTELQRKDAMAKEAETLAADPKWGEFYKANAEAIQATANKCNCDLSTAKLLVYDAVGPVKMDEEAIAKKAIQEFIEKKRTLNTPTEGSGATPVEVVSAPKTFDDARKAALSRLRSIRDNN